MRIQNWPALIRVLEHIIANPESWSQTTWRCGTTRCVAGWIAELAGHEWVAYTESRVWSLDAPPELIEASQRSITRSQDWGRYTLCAEDAALNALGVAPISNLDVSDLGDDGQERGLVASYLFGGGLTWDAILESVHDLAAHDGYTLPASIRSEMERLGMVEAFA